MTDDKPFTQVADRPYLIIAEVKRRECDLNGPWTKPNDQNMHRVLRAIGAFPQATVNDVANSLYESGVFSGDQYHVSLCCFGETSNTKIAGRYPQVPQKLWPQVLDFIYTRFREYHRQKASHPQWDIAGRTLWDWYRQSSGPSEFVQRVNIQG